MVNILLLGRSIHTQQLTDVLVRNAQYSVVEVDSSLEARRIVSTFPNSFDLVIADIDSPEVHGIEFLEELRQTESPAAIVIMTHDKSHVVEAIRFGIAGYLIRPLTPKQLVKVVHNALASDYRIRTLVNATRPFTVHPSIQAINLPSAS